MRYRSRAEQKVCYVKNWNAECAKHTFVFLWERLCCGIVPLAEGGGMENNMEKLLQVGVITSTHGVRGEVKVFPTTDDMARFKKLKNVILDTGKEKIDLEIAGVKFFKNMVILKFKGIDNINDVEQYRKKSLYVTRENAVKLKKDEYFIADLIGLSVCTDEGEALGEVADVLQTGANDVYIIRTPEGEEILLPAIKECVKEVKVEEGSMLVHLLPGLREINQK